MSSDGPLLPSEPLDAADERLLATFDGIEKQQLDFFDSAAKRIIELVTALLGVLVTLLALGDKFPPAYLAGHAWVKGLAAAALVCYVLALVAAAITTAPRRLKRYAYNLTLMRQELDSLLAVKARWLTIAGLLFGLGAITLALALALIITSA